jgi:hypothetical protein
VPSVSEPGQWFLNLGSERDWNFRAEPSTHLNGRGAFAASRRPARRTPSRPEPIEPLVRCSARGR